MAVDPPLPRHHPRPRRASDATETTVTTTDRRARALEALAAEPLDVLVIGGGINGAAATLALTAHGARVACVTRDDVASGTSEQSSNLIWGGFKYLEGYEFSLVAKLCASRNRLVRAFPSRLVETRFLATLDISAPHRPWFAALGAHAYWLLGRCFTQRPRLRRPSWIAADEPVVDTSAARGGIEYSDYVIVDNDARFVANFFFDAVASGATVVNYAEIGAARRDGDVWICDVTDRVTGQRITVTARVLVNAGGPAAESVATMLGTATDHRLVLSKGIHLIVPQLTRSRRVLAFFDDSKRLFYVIPMGHRSVVGTTDSRTDDPTEGVTDDERRELLDQINRRLAPTARLDPEDVIAERVGVRPLVVDRGALVDGIEWTALSRRHAVEVDPTRLVITIMGGKLTDCTNVGREIVAAARELGVSVQRPRATGWFGEPHAGTRDEFLGAARAAGFAWRPRFEPEATHAEVLWRRYGSRASAVLALAGDASLTRSMMDVADFCEAEILHMHDSEMIVKIEDFLRRRTSLLQLYRAKDLAADPGVGRAATILLGGEAGLEELRTIAAQSPA